MANISKRVSKDGAITFYIRGYDGYSADGKQRRQSMKWTAPAGMSERKAEKEAQKQALMFEQRLSGGICQDGNMKLEPFTEKWMKEYVRPKLKEKTVDNYQKLLPRINTALGHMKLKDLRTGHINAFYANLQEYGINGHTGGKLSPESVLSYHRCLSSVLAKAVKWGFIPYNPAANAELPKRQPKEASYLDEPDARRLLVLLHNEPIKYRAIITFDLLSGLRRGELLGLRWQDVDFAAQTITICQTLNYTVERGLYFDRPKTETSSRSLKLSASAFAMLRELKQWEEHQRETVGTCWKDTGLVFVQEMGNPILPDGITQWFHKFIARSGLPPIHIHSLRHTYASVMISDGTPLVVVSRRLGHSQISTTANIYTHMIQSADARAATVTDKFDDAIFGNGQENTTGTA